MASDCARHSATGTEEKKYEEKWREKRKSEQMCRICSMKQCWKSRVKATRIDSIGVVVSVRYVESAVSARYNHMDMAHLEEILKECVAKGTRQRMIVTDGVIHSVGMHENPWFAHVSRVLDDSPRSNVIVIQNVILHVFL